MKKLIIKEKIVTFFDSYKVYDEKGNHAYTVKGELSLGHCFKIYDNKGKEVAVLKEQLLKLFQTFKIIKHGDTVGHVQRELSLFRPKFDIDFRDWKVKGDIMEWDYVIKGNDGEVAKVCKKLLRLTDTYEITVKNDGDALDALIIAVAIDAFKCSKGEN